MVKKLSKEEQSERQLKLERIKETSEKIFNLLFVEDELSWKDMIYALIEEENMNPWDIDITLLSQKFLEMLRKLKELDFRVSGKMILASAVLLKMKSDILIDEDIANFDSMMNGINENIPLDDLERTAFDSSGKPELYPRTPQPRQRKVSLFDLVQALEKALEVENRRKISKPNMKKMVLKIPDKKLDLGTSMKNVFEKVENHYNTKKNKGKTLTFNEMVTGTTKQDKVLVFVPLLHLDNLRKINLDQKKHFEEIAVTLAVPDEVNSEKNE